MKSFSLNYRHAFLWAWIVGMVALYLFQFRHFIDPILKKLGLS